MLETLDQLEETCELFRDLLQLLNRAFLLLDWDTDRLYDTVPGGAASAAGWPGTDGKTDTGNGTLCGTYAY